MQTIRRLSVGSHPKFALKHEYKKRNTIHLTASIIQLTYLQLIV